MGIALIDWFYEFFFRNSGLTTYIVNKIMSIFTKTTIADQKSLQEAEKFRFEEEISWHSTNP